MPIDQSEKLAGVAYDVRGPVLAEAMRMEAEGHRILRLNIGNPAPFGFEAPEAVLEDVIRNLPLAQGYSDARGLLSARRAVVQYHERLGVAGVGVDDVYLGNGVSELIAIALQALLNNDDEVLIPAPDYPLWTAVVSLCRGRAVHYRCDEGAGWLPDLDDIAARITPRTKALVVINPNNPTGAVYPRDLLEGLVDLARRHELVLYSDEIYDRILYDGAQHTATAALAPDVLTLTFNGLSKAYRVAGFRSGWMVVSGPTANARGYLEGLDILANMRLCANVPGQHAIQPALGTPDAVSDLVLPGGRLLEQRNRAWELLSEIPGRLVREADGGDVHVPAARSRRAPDRRRRALRARPPAGRAPAGRAGHRLQLAAARPLPPGHAAACRRPDRGDRPHRPVPRVVPAEGFGRETTMMRRAFAALYDRMNKGTEAAGIRGERHELLAHAHGATIEIGAGTGLNLEHYPGSVTRLVLSEPDEHMRRRLAHRADALRPAAEVIDAGAEGLPFADATFDTAVVTWVLCSVPDQRVALREIARVLKPDGRLLFLEHVRSDDPQVARRQDRIRPVYSCLSGCNPNRETLAAIEASGFEVESVRHGEVPKAPTFERPMIVGSARR